MDACAELFGVPKDDFKFNEHFAQISSSLSFCVVYAHTSLGSSLRLWYHSRNLTHPR